MSQIRRDLDEHVDEIVDSARQLTDWRAYIGANPWPFLGVAAGLGYLVMPTRVTVDRPVADTLASLARQGEIQITRKPEPTTIFTQLRDMGISMATSIALQAGVRMLQRALNPSPPTEGPGPDAADPSSILKSRGGG
jgi:hypothetical protein